MTNPPNPPIVGTCHCGAVVIELALAPSEITHCNCSLCRRLGVLWTYAPIAEVKLSGVGPTDSYAWGGKNVDFHRCRTCGCLTHWIPRKQSRKTMGINARLFDPQVVLGADLKFKDDAGTGRFY